MIRNPVRACVYRFKFKLYVLLETREDTETFVLLGISMFGKDAPWGK
jgi:hypothetical protein